MAQCPSPKAVRHVRGMSFFSSVVTGFCLPVSACPYAVRTVRQSLTAPEGERSPQATWNVPSCALTQQIEKAGDFWQEQLNLHSPPAPHTRFSLFIFILFIFHFNTKQQLFMFYEGSINMQKKNLKLINRIIIICLSQNELLSYIYIYILVSAKMGDVSSWRNNNNTQKALWQRRVLCFAPSTLFLLD